MPNHDGENAPQAKFDYICRIINISFLTSVKLSRNCDKPVLLFAETLALQTKALCDPENMLRTLVSDI
jgi:hypothetical protein